jgi:hypothetical protein
MPTNSKIRKKTPELDIPLGFDVDFMKASKIQDKLKVVEKYLTEAESAVQKSLSPLVSNIKDKLNEQLEKGALSASDQETFRKLIVGDDKSGLRSSLGNHLQMLDMQKEALTKSVSSKRNLEDDAKRVGALVLPALKATQQEWQAFAAQEPNIAAKKPNIPLAPATVAKKGVGQQEEEDFVLVDKSSVLNAPVQPNSRSISERIRQALGMQSKVHNTSARASGGQQQERGL